MAGVDQLQTNLSVSGSVIAITPLYLMILDVPHRRMDVRSLVPPGSIGA